MIQIMTTVKKKKKKKGDFWASLKMAEPPKKKKKKKKKGIASLLYLFGLGISKISMFLQISDAYRSVLQTAPSPSCRELHICVRAL